AHISPLGCAVGNGSTDMCRTLGISADRFLPSIRYVIGTLRTPRFLPISGASCAMGPPAAPVKIAPSASVCLSSARSSIYAATDQFPSAMGPGVWMASATLRPSSTTLPYRPLSIWKISGTLHTPSVGREVKGADFDTKQGHTIVQLQFSK